MRTRDEFFDVVYIEGNSIKAWKSLLMKVRGSDTYGGTKYVVSRGPHIQSLERLYCGNKRNSNLRGA